MTVAPPCDMPFHRHISLIGSAILEVIAQISVLCIFTVSASKTVKRSECLFSSRGFTRKTTPTLPRFIVAREDQKILRVNNS